ncbi:MAG: hypothetical protein HZA34_02145 [Candidatus Pacebacteria bacterium]|nr:hypothetical protein [Candidatus Paceibacterota bacterium]
MDDLISTVNYIVNQSVELKNKYTHTSSAKVEFCCIFCQNEKEYKQFTDSIKILGRVVERTESGFTYLLDKPLTTVAGPLRLIKIRKQDNERTERGDADFNTNYRELKEFHKGDSKFELIKRESFEMLRLTDPKFDVMVCFSNIPKSNILGVKL